MILSTRTLFRWASCLSTVAVAVPTTNAVAQYQADTIVVGRNFHDAAWVAGGTALTFTLKELGVKREPAALLGSVGLVSIVKLAECRRWCGRADVDWPARIVIKDAIYDMTLASASAPLLIGRKRGWKAGVGAGLVWVGAVALMREARWNSP